MLVQELAHVGNEMSLQSIYVVDAQLLHLLLTEAQLPHDFFAASSPPT